MFPNFKAGIFVCASLPNEKARRAHFLKPFSDSRQVHFVESIFGGDWTIEYAEGLMSPSFRELWKLMRERGRTWINQRAIACAITHRDRLLSIAEEGDCILCEDDALIKDNFIRLWKEEENRKILRDLGGIVLMNYTSRSEIFVNSNPVGNIGNYKIFRSGTKSVSSAACYYVPPLIAPRLRAIQTPLIATADSWGTFSSSLEGVDVFLIDPPPCTIGNFASTIGYRDRNIPLPNTFFVKMLRSVGRRLLRLRKKNFTRVQKTR